MKPTDKIPIGVYCYDKDGICPYWSLDPTKPKQNNGFCALLKYGDWESNGWVSLLWDQVKECERKVYKSKNSKTK